MKKHHHPSLQPLPLWALRTGAAALLACGLASALAQQVPNFPITPGQRATAQQVANAGVPLSELAPNAPDSYTIKKGDTLWAISGLFLKSPWRWPELWGMNLDDIRNPHLIYPGQELYLDKTGGRARLRMGRAGVAETVTDAAGTVKLSPRVRSTPAPGDAIPTLPPNLIEPFLADAAVIEPADIDAAPRIVAAADGRVLLTRGDRAYARGKLMAGDQAPRFHRIFRNATPLKDPTTGEILGYEAMLVGRSELVRSESSQPVAGSDGGTEIVPATVDILEAKEEMRVGDRLLPEPPRDFFVYAPRAPATPVSAQVVSIYGSAVRYAAQNQVVTINKGKRDGIERGHVLAILKEGGRVVDKTDPDRPTIKLPDERNGLLMVFRTFDRVSYALVLQIAEGVKVGDRLVNPR